MRDFLLIQCSTKLKETKRNANNANNNNNINKLIIIHKPNCKFNRFKTKLKNEEEKLEGKKGVKISMRIERI